MMKEKVFKTIISLILGFGRIISAAALQSLNINGAFRLWGLSKGITETLAGTAAVSSSISNTTTRITSIYKKLPPKCEADNLTGTQKSIVYTLFTLGVIDSFYFAANNFNAIVELRCNVFGETDCDENFWGAHPAYLVLGGYGALSGQICFFAFTLAAIKENAIAFTEYNRNFRTNVAKEKKLLLEIAAIALLSSISTGALLYFSTSKTIHNFFGHEASQNLLIQSQVPLAMGIAIIANLFSQVASGKKLLKDFRDDPRKMLRQWFLNPQGWIKARIIAGLTFFLLDAIFSGIGGYPGSHKLLENINKLPGLIVIILAVLNAINSGFLYFAFNTRAALDMAADVASQKPDPQRQPLLGKNPFILLPAPGANNAPNINNPAPTPRSSYSCAIV